MDGAGRVEMVGQATESWSFNDGIRMSWCYMIIPYKHWVTFHPRPTLNNHFVFFHGSGIHV